MMMKWCLSMLVLTAVLAGTVAAAEQERQRGVSSEASGHRPPSVVVFSRC
jgi:hypothetical protein